MSRIFSRFVLKNAGVIVLLSTLISIVAAFFTVLLYSNLKPDFEELLPPNARSVRDVEAVQNRMASSDYLAVLAFAKNFESGKKFADEFAAKLDAYPKDEISYVEYNIKDEFEFFDKRKALYLKTEDLSEIRAYVKDKIRYEKDKSFSIFGNLDWDEPKFDFEALKKKYSSQASSFSHFPENYYALEGPAVFALLVGIPNQKKNIGGSYEFRKLVLKNLEELNPDKRGIEIKLTGGVQDILEEHSSLISDLGLVTAVVLVLTIAIMYFFFLTSIGVLCICIALIFGTLWTCAIAYFIFGYVNMNSAFMSSIIIGNGVNFGIIFLARYLEALRSRQGHERATFIAIQKTPKATLTAALAAGCAYGSLMFTDFRGFKQFGMIGFIGMILCWISAYLVLPAFMTFFREILVRKYMRKVDKNVSWILPKKKFFVANWVTRKPKLILAISGILLAISSVALLTHKGTFLETDLTKMRDKNSLETGSGHYSEYLHKIFKGYPHPLGIMTDTEEQAQQLHKLLNKKIAQGNSYLGKSTYIDDFVPLHQMEKISIIRDIKKSLSDPLLKWSKADMQSTIDKYITTEALRPFTVNDLPELIKRKLSEKDGSIGRLVLVEPIIGKTESVEELTGFIEELRAVADSVSDGMAVAGQLAVSADLVEEIKREGPKTTAIAFFAVVILVLILFRRFRISVLLLTSLILGVVWLLAIMSLFNLKINFLNFVVLPITFGIAVDYGVNIMERYRIEGPGKIKEALQFTGTAVLLASLTTIIGYGGLVIAGNQAIASFGYLAVIGEFTCLFTAMLTVPAVLYLVDKRNKDLISK